MSENFLRDYPDLAPFVLANVRPTGRTIGKGAYGSVCEVAIPGAVCAAKEIHEFFQDRTVMADQELRAMEAKFLDECRLMSTLRHPHVTQFLGLCFLPGSKLPSLVMELMQGSLHEFLDPKALPDDASTSRDPLPLDLGQKQSLLHGIASGLAYLHHHSPPIAHRDLSAKNVLLTSAMVAKIADLGVARIAPRYYTLASQTKGPGAIVYMPPEAIAADGSSKYKYGVSIDIFSLGVLAIFTLIQQFPWKLLAATYTDENSGELKARSELERRHMYMEKVYSKLEKGHPLVQLIHQCLDNNPNKRPDVDRVLELLEQVKSRIQDDEDRQKQVLNTKTSRSESLQIEKGSLIKEKETLIQVHVICPTCIYCI